MNVRGRWRGDRFSLGLALIAAAGFVMRIAYVLVMRDRRVTGDGAYYHDSANLLVDGRAFVNPLALRLFGVDVPNGGHPPAWTLLLAGPSALGFRSFLAHQLVACAFGAAAIVMTGVAGRAAFGRRTGIVAAALVAVYPNVWLYEREVMAETLAFLGVATTIWLAYRFRAGPGVTGAALLGLAVGALAMTRPELIALALFLVVPLVLLASGEWRQRITWLAAAGIGCAVVIAPWGIYNSTRFERPVPLTTSYGSAMLSGNCAPTYHGELLGYYAFGCVLRKGFSSDPSIADGEQREAAFEFMGDNLSRVPVVMAARVGRTFGVFRPFQQVQLDRAGYTPAWVFRLGLFMYWALLPFAVAGAVIARRRGIPIYPLLVFPLAVLLSVLLTIGQTRYRAPAEIPLALLAAVAIETGLRSWRPHFRQTSRRQPARVD